jgi:iron complex outermembrane receptor protein
MTKFFAASAATLALCLSYGPAMAQDADASAPSDEEGQGVPEIVVTAQHRNERMQDVPIAVSAIGGEALTKSGVASVQDLAGAVPGLVVSKSVSYGLAPIAIRGIGGPVGGGSLLTDQPVAVYVDGVYVRALGQSTSDFFDVDRIQVLRGPQGTLYGRNSTAGAMLIESRRADAEAVSGNVSASYGSFDQLKLSGAINLPLVTGKVGLRVAASHSSGGDWADNVVDDREFGGGHSTNVRASLRVKPSDRLTIDLIGEYGTSTARPAILPLSTVSLTGIGAGGAQLYAGTPHIRRPDYTAVRESRDVQVLGDLYTRSKSDNATLNMAWEASDSITLTSITGYRRFRVSGVQDSSPWVTGTLPGQGTSMATWNGGAALNSVNSGTYRLTNPTGAGTFALGWNQTEQKFKTISQEFRVAGDMGAFKWTGGLYYTNEKIDGSIRIVNEQGGPPMTTGGIPPVAGAAGLNLGFTTSQDRDIYAAFFDGTYDFSEQLALTAGIRYTRDEKDVALLNTTRTLRPSTVPALNAGTAIDCPGLVAAGAGTACSRTDEEFTPRVVLTFKATPNNMLYASWSKGFTAGGFNNFATVASAPIVPLDVPAEKISNFEIGTKNEFLDRRLRLNLTAFLSDYDNLQIRQAVNTGGVAIVPVERARIKGIELELAARPIDGLTLGINGAYIDAKIVRGTLNAFPNAIGTINLGSNQTPAATSVAGNRMTRAPKWQGNVMASYELPVSYGQITLSGTMRFQSKTEFQETNQALSQFKGESWTEFDLRLATGGDKWEVALAANNLFDNRHISQIVPFFMFPNATLNAPRNLGVSASFNF